MVLKAPGPPRLDEMRETMTQRSFDLPETTRSALVGQYLHLTRTVMPALARTTNRHWPVRNDHCFQRIVLDTICGGIWYDHIARPAYRHLSKTQAMQSVQLCDAIIAGTFDLGVLNRQSLAWRGKGVTTVAAESRTLPSDL